MTRSFYPLHGSRLDAPLRHAVLGWTAFLSVFLWTSLNRALWRPEIATWMGFGMEGRGPGPWTAVVAASAGVVLGLFYLEGRGRARPLVRGTVLVIHGSITVYMVTAALRSPQAEFQGDTWGWAVPLPILALPFVVFTLLAAVWVVRDRRAPGVASRRWSDFDVRSLLLALGLTPIIALTFGSGDEMDVRAKVSTALAVLQWVVFVSALESPRPARSSPTGRQLHPDSGGPA